MVYSDYTERRILIYSQNYKPPAMHKSIELWEFPFNVHFNYSAAPHALKLYRTVYSPKTRRRSFHTFTQPLFLNDATVYTAFISNGMDIYFGRILYMFTWASEERIKVYHIPCHTVGIKNFPFPFCSIPFYCV